MWAFLAGTIVGLFLTILCMLVQMANELGMTIPEVIDMLIEQIDDDDNS